ncbi:hypothetical protein DV735_g3157, partial [Chaetothyriales sp. CBS 134920]
MTAVDLCSINQNHHQQTRFNNTSVNRRADNNIDVTALKERLGKVDESLKKITAIAGTPGLSVGVSYKGEVIHQFSHGLRDVEDKLPFDKNTVIPIGTIAKTFTASAIGILVSQKKLTWTSRIRDILPDFRSSDPVVEAELNVTDLLSHRAGLARSNLWWQGSNSVLLLDKKDLLSFYAKLPRAGVFRADWAYSNWGYALVGAVIEKVSGVSYGEFVRREIIVPLGLERTTFKALNVFDRKENIAKPYAALDDSSPHLLPPPPVNDDTIMGPAMGGASTAADLLKYSIALLEAQNRESSGDSSGDFVLKGSLKQLSGHISIAPSVLEKTYALGWYRSQLPGSVLGMGWNSIYVAKMPQLLPRGHSGPVVSHGGSLPGYHTAIALLPALQASVVVCTNSIALGDVSGWTSLAVLEALIDSPQPSDFVALATEAASKNATNVSRFEASLSQARPGDRKEPLYALNDYVGTYHDLSRDWKVDVRLNEARSALEILFRGLESQKWPLSYYGQDAHGDTFLWLASREEQAKRCRMTTYPLVANHFKIIFKSDDSGRVVGIYWPHEAGIQLEEQFLAKL